MYHSLTAVGRLGRDPELRYTPDGTPVCNFSLATDVGWGDNEKTIWFRVTAWGKTGEACSRYLSKGAMVLVRGELQEPNVFQRQGGDWDASLNVTAREVKFLQTQRRETGSSTKVEEEAIRHSDEVEEIPF